jgi:hypothetical protein
MRYSARRAAFLVGVGVGLDVAEPIAELIIFEAEATAEGFGFVLTATHICGASSVASIRMVSFTCEQRAFGP